MLADGSNPVVHHQGTKRLKVTVTERKSTNTRVPDTNCRQRANGNTVWRIAEVATHIDASKDASCSWKKHTKHCEECLARSIVSMGVVGQNSSAVPNETVCYNEN